MTDLHILLDNTNFDRKPTSKETASINNRLNHLFTQITLEDFAAQVTTPNGKSYCPANFNGNRGNENWISQQVFALDFDNDKTVITFDAVLAKLNEYGLDCTFAYSTFSSTTDLPKFRVIFQTDLITDLNERNAIQFGLIELFKANVDISCKDPARLYFGGKDLIYQNYSYVLDVDLLKTAVTSILIAPTNYKNKGRVIDGCFKKLNIEEKRGLLNMQLSDPRKSSLLEPSTHSKLNWGKDLEDIDFEKLRLEVLILNDLMNDKWMTYPELRGLAMNLIHIKGGEKLYKTILNNSIHSYEQKHLDLPAICKKYKYLPQALKNFSSYEEDWVYENLLTAARLERGTVRRLAEYNPMTLEEAENQFKSTFEKALADDSNSIWVIRKATGLGGTAKLLNLTDKIIAFPNHFLKSEVASNFKVPFVSTPDLPFDKINEKLSKRIKYLYSIGAVISANNLIKRESKTNKDLKEYLQETLKAYVSCNTVLTTHSKALFIDFNNHNTIIFDEDPLSTILETGEITLNDLNRLAQAVTNKKDKTILEKYINIITSGLTNCVESSKEFILNNISAIEDIILNNKDYDSNVLNFLKSDYYALEESDVSKLYFLKHNSLNSGNLRNKKIIILSATANEFIYKALYGNRVKFIDISKVELKGAIIQDTQYSLSRASMKNEKVLNEVKSKLPEDIDVITFAGFKHSFENAVPDLHFGKCTGSNILEGKDLAVIGTPHIKSIQYLLYAKALDIKISPHDFKMNLSRVIHNDLEFRIVTFNKKELQWIQFHFIEEQIKQAIGRGRALRNMIIVYFHSSYPLPESCLTEKEKYIGLCKLNRN